MYYSKIVGLGHYVPENVISNQYLESIMDTNDAWITERTGIKERRYFTYGKDTNASMATEAAKIAIERAGLTPQEIDFIVYATITPDYYFPGPGFVLQRNLGMQNVGVLDIRDQCSGFVYALSTADQFIRSGMYKNILVIGAEIQSTFLNHTTEGRGVAVIFGDGAGAAVVQATTDPSHRILSTHLHADGTYAEDLYVKDPGSSRPKRFYDDLFEDKNTGEVIMNGNMVFKHAVVRFPEVIKEALDKNNLSPEDIDLLVPHQANLRISEYVRQQMGLPEEKVMNNIQKYGNTTAASIPIALSEAWEMGKIKDGHLVCLAAFGSGFTWGSALIRW
ncbi:MULTISPECIES: beta-ketoacyl-ACP synthase III [Flectobacillus]|uniref:Beta-ketoacyl-[acyl-carrier-protein] synthase III n=1 Tax=Flectobacillus roseus TaxID=502259 RepID=A0ABT6Y6A1_9BACT|nr:MULTISPECIES: beta-ketoacyl-ACP synthase III [Flectobacillus]MDI9859102.1 beta-ketoacyl-ACP synthase III [Flectobacillus roseus]MDI9868203.1 beta-ketoacyl-ACP synthase III [Flectobacillus roseus]NBA78814.1 beta-ketoacyl-ACP synthase III [Emticicia sp. ODNR4P]PAC33181.1 3-oxoacyl-ACP synthase [Flectobacillus sp. BAB-3569]